MSQHDRILKVETGWPICRRCGGFIDSHATPSTPAPVRSRSCWPWCRRPRQRPRCGKPRWPRRRRPRQSRNIAARLLNIRRRKPLTPPRPRRIGASLRKNGVSASPSARAKSRWRSTTMCSPSPQSMPARPSRSIRRRRRRRSLRPPGPMCRWSPIFSPPPERNSNSFRASRKAKLSSSAPTGKSPSQPG